MIASEKAGSVRFTTKGQVVIPLGLRKQFQIEKGTRAIVEATEDGILLTPITPVSIRRLRGILKRPAGGKSLAEEMKEHKQMEKNLEEEKHGRRLGAR